MTYDYQCRRCSREFEARHRLTDDPPPCPDCGGTELKRLISSGTTFQLKGGGWYADGYGSTR